LSKFLGWRRERNLHIGQRGSVPTFGMTGRKGEDTPATWPGPKLNARKHCVR
jgi:hypothetical protein